MSPRTKARRKALDLTPKKVPRQPRARATFDAIIDACTRLLPELGYAGATTNHIASAAGVGIASVYEYFPGKDAIVAQVADRFVRRVVARLELVVPDVLRGRPEDAVRRLVDVMYAAFDREKKLVAVFVYEVPYASRLDSFRSLGPLLLDLVRSMRARLGARVRLEHEEASFYLMVNLATSTILQLALDPPPDIPQEDILATLSHRIEAWLLGPA